MEEISVDFTIEELIEPTGYITLGTWVFIYCDYDNEVMSNGLTNKIYSAGFLYVPETKAFRAGGPCEPPFMPSLKIDEELIATQEAYDQNILSKIIPGGPAQRYFEEQYQTSDQIKVPNNPRVYDTYKSIEEKYE
jgi:hypothetical protein